MPYTKRKVHHGRADDLLDYIMDEEKTDGGLLITGLNCNPDLAKTEFINTALKNDSGTRVAYHLIQSFCPLDDITPEQAHEIGVRLCKELYPHFQTVVTTHIDRGHIHNHIAINAVALDGHKLNDKLSDKKEGLYAYKSKSDEIAAEYGCYILPEFKFDNKGKKKQSDMYRAYKHQTWRQQIISDMNELKLKSSSFNEFIINLFDKGYDIKYGKYISVKPQGKERFVRLKTLSEEYSEDNLRLYFNGKVPEYDYKYNRRFTENEINEKYVDYYNELQISLQLTASVAIKGGRYPTFQRTRKVADVRRQQLEDMLNTLEKNNINNFDELENKIRDCRRKIRDANRAIQKEQYINKGVLERIEKAQAFISLKSTYDYAMYYKSLDSEYELPPECKLYEQLSNELGITTVNEANEIIKSSGQLRKHFNQLRSEVYDMQQELYQYDLFKEQQLLNSDAFIHNIKVGNNRIDYANSTDTHWCINLPYCDYYVMFDKTLATFNHKYGYNTLFLVDDAIYQIYKKSENGALEKEITLNGTQLDDYVAELKLHNIEQHKEKEK